MKKEKLTTQPYKGTSDWLPDEFLMQKYIFDTWRKVCLKFGYKEYLTPLLDPANLYKAKSGEVAEELFTLEDRAGRNLALRPEMTPSVTRMVASIYKETSKPIRLFSIAPFYRNEAPQKGRTREFWQLNADIFGEDSLEADLEVLSLAVEIMLAFDAPKNSFKLYFNSRNLVESLFSKLQIQDNKLEVARAMDKFDKIGTKETKSLLEKQNLDAAQIEGLINYLNGDISNLDNGEIKYFVTELKKLGYADYVEFKPSIIRGFDYYDGMIFEVFDLNSDNNRSLFGGGRYNGLSEIFGIENFPATGFAPGNVTTKLFLENWNLIPKDLEVPTYYLPTLTAQNILKIANELRGVGMNVQTELKQTSISDALRKANTLGLKKVIILGKEELANNAITVKDLETGDQETQDLKTWLANIS
ncbi:histidine--tRNA ligase [Patescibacteria group bacterium]